MPTGYTAELCEKDVEFKKFVMRCARNFGALILMRDEPWDAPIPETFKPSDYSRKGRIDAMAELKQIESMTPEAAIEESVKEYKKAKKALANAAEEAASTRKRLEAMRDKVLAWDPPTPDHEGMKTFMIEQLDGTIKQDGTVSSYYAEQVKVQGGAEWKSEKIASLKNNIAYHEKQHAEEVERTEARNKWVADLRASLGK